MATATKKPAAKKPAEQAKTTEEKAHPADADGGTAQVQATVDKIEDKGFIGEKVDPLPNEAHSLESGPDAPPAVPDDQTRAGMPVLTKEN